MKTGSTTLAVLFSIVSLVAASAEGTDKTLVAWVAAANLTQQGGSALTIQSGERFDAIVLGEQAQGKWMAGSNFLERTQKEQNANAPETAGAETLVQIAIAYEGDDIRIYRNAAPYAAYKTKNIDLLGVDNHIAVFGLRHIGANTGAGLAGAIEDARIYDRALTQAEIASLKPNEKSSIEPLAWWDFQGDRAVDRAGHFGHCAMTEGARLVDGRLVLDGKGYLVAARSAEDAQMATRAENARAPMPPYVALTPSWPENPPTDWLTFHLAHPGPGNAFPGDPNCGFDYKGRYHLHYIYNDNGFVFGHVSSDDMVHWKWHPTVLAPQTTGHGMFSGTGFYTKEGKPAIIYHGAGSNHNWIQYALDDQFNSWSAPEAVLPKTADGKLAEMRHWDPDCWINGDTYYALSGGGNPQLAKSTDLKNWTYLGDVLHKDFPEDLGVPKGEDISCANMFKIGNKWMLLCISHPLGCRYYLGDFKDEKYLPEFHAMMNWQKAGDYGFYFAPESILTRDGRRVMWAWLISGAAPTGVQALPRELELPEDGILRIKPLRELQSLRYEPQAWTNIAVQSGNELALEQMSGDALEIEITIAAPLPEQCGMRLLGDENGEGSMQIAMGAENKTLQIGHTSPPFELKKGEDLTLRIFIDKNLVEVFANDRQAAAFAHPHIRKNPNVRLFACGGDAVVKKLQAWKMKTIYEGDTVFEGEAEK